MDKNYIYQAILMTLLAGAVVRPVFRNVNGFFETIGWFLCTLAFMFAMVVITAHGLEAAFNGAKP